MLSCDRCSAEVSVPMLRPLYTRKEAQVLILCLESQLDTLARGPCTAIQEGGLEPRSPFTELTPCNPINPKGERDDDGNTL